MNNTAIVEQLLGLGTDAKDDAVTQVPVSGSVAHVLGTLQEEKEKDDQEEKADEKEEKPEKKDDAVAVASPEANEEPEEDESNEPVHMVSVQSLLSDWEAAGDEDEGKRSVAVRVLDELDNYVDFVELCFRLGEADAEKLGSYMDELAREESPVSKALAGKELAGIEPLDTMQKLKARTLFQI